MLEPLSRRSVLRTLAIGVGTAPVLPSLGRGFLPSAHASTSGVPRRLVLIQNPLGSPAGAGDAMVFKPGPTWAESQFGTMFVPLERHKDNTVIVHNTEQRRPSDYRDPSSNHGTAVRYLYTGSAEVERGRAQNASIDQYVGQKLSGTVKFPVVMPGIQFDSTCSYGADGRPIAHEINPYTIYQRLFSEPLAVGNVSSDAAVKGLLARRKSVLDFVTADLTAFRARLGKDDQARADIQLNAIRTLERSLVAGAGGGNAGCAKPAPPAQGLEFRHYFSKDVPAVFQAMIDLSVAALACDLTRVVNIQIYGEDNHNSTCQFDPVNTGSAGWHALSHLTNGVDTWNRAKQWLAGMAAKMADRLAAIPEGGGTMLDNTVIWFAQDQGEDHRWYGYRQAIIGGKNLGIKVGQYLRCGGAQPNTGTEQNRLLVGLLNAMGLPDETYGVEPANATGKGPLKGFLK